MLSWIICEKTAAAAAAAGVEQAKGRERKDGGEGGGI